MANQFSRTELLFKKEGIEKLNNSKVAVFGIGGVGGYVVEALARAGIGHFDLIDNDTVSITNINRQIIATLDTVGKYKCDVMKDRILSINKDAIVNTFKCFYLPENSDQFDFTKYDYVIDAIDTITAKIDIIVKCKGLNVPIISSMGTGNKINPTMLEVTDIYKTSVCPLAKVMRYELKKRRIKSLKVVYSKENPIKVDNKELMDDENVKKNIPGSTSFVPSTAGLIIASEVIKDILNLKNN